MPAGVRKTIISVNEEYGLEFFKLLRSQLRFREFDLLTKLISKKRLIA